VSKIGPEYEAGLKRHGDLILWIDESGDLRVAGTQADVASERGWRKVRAEVGAPRSRPGLRPLSSGLGMP